MRTNFHSRKIRTGSSRTRKAGRIFTVIFSFLAIAAATATIAYQKDFEQKIYTGVMVGAVDLGGKTTEEAAATLNEFGKKIEEEGVAFVAETEDGKKKKINISPALIGMGDPDLSRHILTVDPEKTVALAFQIGREGNFSRRISEEWQAITKGKEVDLKFWLDEKEFKSILEQEFSALEEPPTDARLITDETGQLSVTSEKNGYGFDYEKALTDAKESIGRISDEPIRLKIAEKYPRIRENDAADAVQEAYELMNLAPISVKYGRKERQADRETVGKWLELQVAEGGEIVAGFGQERFSEFLKPIAEEIEVEPKNARFVMKSGKVTDFSPSTNGIKIDIRASYLDLCQKVIAEGQSKITLTTKETEPKIAISDINDLGIRELIGTGKSNFAGSPTNRRHNIKVGAEKLNGTLIAPDEEFSAITTLGNVDEEAGYLPELVIKGNQTIREYGGGLCQIGTTAFRVALDAGLPIAERQPHSYRVSYYEPAGTDATIYMPHPDLKFVNDTGNNLLLTTKIEGDNLTFELWGTSDGRQVELTEPKIYNITKPAPPKYIETEDFKPGEKKRIETAHNGADAEFTRTITYADGTQKTKTWKSHYVPWREVWLIGKKPEPEKKPEEIPEATSNESAPSN